MDWVVVMKITRFAADCFDRRGSMILIGLGLKRVLALTLSFPSFFRQCYCIMGLRSQANPPLVFSNPFR